MTSKEQKAAEAETKRQREFVKEIFYPFLIANTKNVTEAKRICQEVQASYQQKYQQKMTEAQKKISEELTSEFTIEDLTKKGEGFKINLALFALFANEKLATTDYLIGGMGQLLDSFVNEEMAARPLASLKATFL